MDKAELISEILLEGRRFDEVVAFDMLCKVDVSKGVNKFKRTIVVFGGDGRFVSGGHYGKIGMSRILKECETFPDIEFYTQKIRDAVERTNCHLVSLEYLNAEHLMWGQQSSKFPKTVQHLLIYLLNEYMPTGILKMEEVDRATNILHSIIQQIFQNEPVDKSLSNKFYESISTNGHTYRHEIINSIEKCQKNLEATMRRRSALESLLVGVRSTINPIDYFARVWLQTEFHEIDRHSTEFLHLNRCVNDTQHPNDRCFRLTNAFKVDSKSNRGFRSNMHNQRLLYHFTFPCSILCILREGFRFKGNVISFCDCASMALDKFHDLPKKPVLLVCRVALGNQQEVGRTHLERNEELRLDSSMNSFVYQGSHLDAVDRDSVKIDGARMYCGKVRQCLRDGKCAYDYNKYIVQNSYQVKIEYILQFQNVN